MALSISSGIPSSAVNLYLFSRHFKILAQQKKLPIRYLRGSRIGKELNSEELKYQRFLKVLKNDAQNSQSSNKIVSQSKIKSNDIENVSSTIEADVNKTQIQRLEEKLTPLKHFTYPRQLEWKYNKALGKLRLFGIKLESLKVPITLGRDKLPCPVDFVIPSPLTEAYRNKDEFSVGPGIDGNEKTIGFYLGRSDGNPHTICASPDGLLITKQCHQHFVKDVQEFFSMSPLAAFFPPTQQGHWKNVIVQSNHREDLMGIIVMHPQDMEKEEIQAEKYKLQTYFTTIAKSYNLKSLYFQACPHSNCTHEQAPYELLLGNESITEEVNGMNLRISPDSFFPPNTKAAEAMLNALLKLCKVKKSTTVLDINSGVGILSLLFSSYVKECVGIEQSSQANADAVFNAQMNGKSNVDFIQGTPELVLKDVLHSGYYEDTLVILNPSKTGISKNLITTLRECRHMKKIIYITNKVESSVDNFVGLCKPCGSHHYLGKAFLPILALPVDNFPQTEHYGLIVMFQRL